MWRTQVDSFNTLIGVLFGVNILNTVTGALARTYGWTDNAPVYLLTGSVATMLLVKWLAVVVVVVGVWIFRRALGSLCLRYLQGLVAMVWFVSVYELSIVLIWGRV